MSDTKSNDFYESMNLNLKYKCA